MTKTQQKTALADHKKDATVVSNKIAQMIQRHKRLYGPDEYPLRWLNKALESIEGYREVHDLKPKK